MTKKLMGAVLVFGFSTLFAGDGGTDIETMQNIFRTNMKKNCKMTGARLAQSHTISEWEKFKEEGKMDDEIYRICPKFPKEVLSPAQFEAFKGFIIEYGLGSKLPAPKC